MKVNQLINKSKVEEIDWNSIAHTLLRKPKDCRRRYNKLKESVRIANLKKGPYSYDEVCLFIYFICRYM